MAKVNAKTRIPCVKNSNSIIVKAQQSDTPNCAVNSSLRPYDAQTFHTKRCVVKIKRIQIGNSNLAKNTEDIVETAHKIKKCVVRINRIMPQNNSKNSRIQNGTVTGISANIGASAHKTNKCVIRINRLSLPQGSFSNDNSQQTVRQTSSNQSMTTSCAIEDEISQFEPQRNSTMCKRGMNNKADKKAVQPTETFKVPLQVRTKHSERPNNGNLTGDSINITKPAKRFFHRNQSQLRRKSSMTRGVYDFLSQSQTTDSETEKQPDPSAAIFKKMVEDGRALMVTRIKKTGKFRAKPTKRRRKRIVGKRKQCSLQSIAEKEPNEMNNMTIHQDEQIQYPMSPVYEPVIESSSEEESPEPLRVSAQIHQGNDSPNRNTTAAESSFSHLARSVLVNQAKNLEKRELLDMARKFISTPVNRKNATSTVTSASAISPILCSSGKKCQTTAGGNASPWRVSDGSPLPNTFIFGLNTSQLPSYSSDYIRRRNVYVPDEAAAQNNNDCQEKNLTSLMVPGANISDGSNNSNAENVPPSATFKTPNVKNISEENNNSGNLVQLPNPRRTLQYRSPLKDINIMDVVVLPSWKKPLQQHTPVKAKFSGGSSIRSPKQHHHFGFEEFLNSAGNENSSEIDKGTQQIHSKQTDDKEISQRQSRQLFGFEEFLDDPENEPTSGLTSDSARENNVTLHDKLQRLKVMRPKDDELPEVRRAPMRHAYDDLQANKPKQRNIKEMLCSTMNTMQESVLTADTSRNLFEELDPEVTFDEKKPRRTYVVQKPKRKRKQRIQLLFFDSDVSEEETDEQVSHDKSDTTPQPRKRKCNRKDAEHEVKLAEFVTSFNKECEEVEKFEIPVE